MRKTILLTVACLTAAVSVWAQQSGTGALRLKLEKWRKVPLKNMETHSLENVSEQEHRSQKYVQDIKANLKYRAKPMIVRENEVRTALKTRTYGIVKGLLRSLSATM